jgi:hypothetical protein
LFEVSRALYSRNQIWNQVGTALVLILHLGPGAFDFFIDSLEVVSKPQPDAVITASMPRGMSKRSGRLTCA